MVGLHVLRYSNIFNLATPKYIEVRRPTDIYIPSVYTYISAEDGRGKTERVRLEIVPHHKSTVSKLITNITRTGNRKMIAFPKTFADVPMLLPTR